MLATHVSAHHNLALLSTPPRIRCSYNALNGVPMCANEWFQTRLMRGEWGLGLATGGGSYCQADCGAVTSIGPGDDSNVVHNYVANATLAAAAALNAGTDMDCFGGFNEGMLQAAIDAGYTSEAVVDASLKRTYTLQFLAGRFDPLEAQPLTRIPFEAIDSEDHRALAFEAALQGMVLLRNDAGILPLPAVNEGRIAVIGPMGNVSESLLGNYFQQRCAADPTTFDCVPTIAAAMLAANGGSGVTFSQGVDMNNDGEGGISAALAAASEADTVVLTLGFDRTVANEALDRSDIRLPGRQLELALAILKLRRPRTVILLLSGTALSVDELAAWTGSAPIAIVQAFLPGQAGGVPIARHLFGFANRWGKLPVTIMPAAFAGQLPLDEMDMAVGPGRTYKYYTGAPLYPMGFGLSYTRFELQGGACSVAGASPTGAQKGMPVQLRASDTMRCSAVVLNVGTRDGDEIVQVYVEPDHQVVSWPAGATKVPFVLRRLATWERVFVGAGSAVTVSFNIPHAQLYSTDAVRLAAVSARACCWPSRTFAFTILHEHRKHCTSTCRTCRPGRTSCCQVSTRCASQMEIRAATAARFS